MKLPRHQMAFKQTGAMLTLLQAPAWQASLPGKNWLCSHAWGYLCLACTHRVPFTAPLSFISSRLALAKFSHHAA